ncbi:hypothetical protein [Brachybacterium massiliense]|uniref:hypothetical protein n=1 Tax=Brachybacterium massiliense TaxID=1755098 RepID=UPI000B3BC2A4|nr:hypothetical protein [Brachybacterium massiliense]
MDITTHITAWREREARPYRAHLLHVLTIAHADEAGVWEPSTKVGLRRALAHRDQPDGEACEAEVRTALSHCIAQGVLREDSTITRLILTGSAAPTTTEENR